MTTDATTNRTHICGDPSDPCDADCVNRAHEPRDQFDDAEDDESPGRVEEFMDDEYCRDCGRPSHAIDNELCPMCFELTGGIGRGR
jgi:hypothetical protein